MFILMLILLVLWVVFFFNLTEFQLEKFNFKLGVIITIVLAIAVAHSFSLWFK